LSKSVKSGSDGITAKAEQNDAAAQHEQPRRDQVETQQVEVQRIPFQQRSLDHQREAQTHDADDDVGLTVVDWQFSAVPAGDAYCYQGSRHRNRPHVAADAAFPGGGDQTAEAVMERESGETDDQGPPKGESVKGVNVVVPRQERRQTGTT
jgi:hypothetical protein